MLKLKLRMVSDVLPHAKDQAQRSGGHQGETQEAQGRPHRRQLGTGEGGRTCSGRREIGVREMLDWIESVQVEFGLNRPPQVCLAGHGATRRLWDPVGRVVTRDLR